MNRQLHFVSEFLKSLQLAFNSSSLKQNRLQKKPIFCLPKSDNHKPFDADLPIISLSEPFCLMFLSSPDRRVLQDPAICGICCRNFQRWFFPEPIVRMRCILARLRLHFLVRTIRRWLQKLTSYPKSVFSYYYFLCDLFFCRYDIIVHPLMLFIGKSCFRSH